MFSWEENGVFLGGKQKFPPEKLFTSLWVTPFSPELLPV